MSTEPPLSLLLLCAPDGRVAALNGPAAEALGPGRGHRCADVVRARDLEDRPVCGGECAVALRRTPGRSRDRDVTVRGQRCRLVCTPMGDHVVVQLVPEGRPAAPADGLSRREREVLELVAEGLSSPAIAGRLGIGVATVRTHVESARRKLGARTRAEAVARWTGALRG